MEFTKHQKMIGISIVTLLVVAGASFYGGMEYAKGKSPNNDMRMTGSMPQMGQERGSQQGGMRGATGMGAGATMGEVIAKDDQSITVKLADGGSKIVFYTQTTSVSKNAEASLSDVAIGEQVQVTGSSNADGSVSAQSIRVGAVAGAPAAR